MNFPKALKRLLQGEAITREVWGETFISLLHPMETTCLQHHLAGAYRCENSRCCHCPAASNEASKSYITVNNMPDVEWHVTRVPS